MRRKIGRLFLNAKKDEADKAVILSTLKITYKSLSVTKYLFPSPLLI